MFALCNSVVLTGMERLTETAVVIDQGHILALLPETELAPAIQRVDLQGAYLVPGFIDLQVNGCGGVMFNSAPTAATLHHMSETNLRAGTTSFLPTFITDSDEKILQALAATRTAQAEHPNQVLGMHLEGPYTNVARKGIHPEQYIRQPSDAMVHTLCDYADALKIITAAPEMNRPEHIRQWVDAGITVSLGHSAATYEQAMAGFAAGMTMATHLYNAMSPTTNGRTPGIVGAVYDHPTAFAGIVGDGIHVHWANVRLAKKALGNRLCLVTDATAAALPPEGFTQFNFCGAEVFVQDGRCVDAHGTIGGSALTMIEGVQRLIEHAGIALDEAIRMATLYPAQAIGLSHHLGTIRAGSIANLAVLDHDLAVVNTWVNGISTKDR